MTAFRDRHRDVMGKGYTELFFTDEATALAAGHRPCFECRRNEAKVFARAWASAFRLETPPRAGEMDAVLHRERTAPRKMTRYDSIPHGAIFSDGRDFWLKHRTASLIWSFDGYSGSDNRIEPSALLRVLTPPSTCAVLSAGYHPDLLPGTDSLVV